MDQNNIYKQILLKSFEKASPAFTENVMASLQNTPARAFVYKPLIPPAVKRVFIFLFIALVALIFVLCLILTLDGIELSQFLNLPKISTESFKQITTAILLFWVLFAANYWITGRRKLNQDLYLR